MTVLRKPTGNTRYRVHTRVFGKPLLVLQVEFHYKGYLVDDSFGGGRDLDQYEWHDASLEDISVGEMK